MAGVAQGAGLDKAYHCYVISLAREPQRRSDFLERIRQTDLSVEVFDAIDGRGLVYDRCVQDGLVAPDADGYKRGRLGCASSHRALWREADRSGRNLLILEDDIYCRRDIAQQIPKILSHLKDWDIVLLGFNTNAVLSFKISEDCDFSGFFSNETPSVQQLEAFTGKPRLRSVAPQQCVWAMLLPSFAARRSQAPLAVSPEQPHGANSRQQGKIRERGFPLQDARHERQHAIRADEQLCRDSAPCLAVERCSHILDHG
jgi:GR25 family glycosyltransferase involved in LPS biosynthesis